MNLWRVPIEEQLREIARARPSRERCPPGWRTGFSISRDGKHLAWGAIEMSYSIERMAFDPAAGKVVGSPVEIVSRPPSPS